mgnify:CR=1 FL=1
MWDSIKGFGKIKKNDQVSQNIVYVKITGDWTLKLTWIVWIYIGIVECLYEVFLSTYEAKTVF